MGPDDVRRRLVQAVKQYGDPARASSRADVAAELITLVAGLSPIVPAPEASARVQALIDAIDARDLGSWPVRACKTELDALAVHATRALFMYCVRADGSVFEMDLDTFAHRAEPVTDPLLRFAVVVLGAMQHPELADLIPVPPAGTRACGLCLATGGPECDCARCRGFGWVQA